MRKRRRSAEVVWAVNCALAVATLGIFWRTVIAAEAPEWPKNPPAPAPVRVSAEAPCDAIWDAKLFIEPPTPPPKPEMPRFTCQGLIGDCVSVAVNGETVDPVRVGEFVAAEYDGHPIRLRSIEKEYLLFVIEAPVEEEIRVPRFPPSEGVDREEEPH